VTVRRACVDLAALDEPLFTGRSLVTASALLDLVSASWLETLAARCRAQRATVLFALSYDGRVDCDPAEPEDADVRASIARHQHTDKGFGPALGPDAVDAAARGFAACGYEVTRARADWTLSAAMPELQRELVIGWADAAIEMRPERAATIEDWKRRRLAHVHAGHSRITVGHEDLAAWLP
jgi:hypothetical protein